MFNGNSEWPRHCPGTLGAFAATFLVAMAMSDQPTAQQGTGLPQCPGTAAAERWHDCIGELKTAIDRKVGRWRHSNLYTGEIFDSEGTQIFTCRDGECRATVVCQLSVSTQRYRCPNGDEFWGFALDAEGKRHGRGTYKWKGGSIYEGEQVASRNHGKGSLVTSDGARYVGDWLNGQRHGHGEGRYADGAHYVGSWADNERNGHGEHTFPNGDRYVGEWKDGRRHGYGEYLYSNGIRHVGQWHEGKRSP